MRISKRINSSGILAGPAYQPYSSLVLLYKDAELAFPLDLPSPYHSTPPSLFLFPLFPPPIAISRCENRQEERESFA